MLCKNCGKNIDSRYMQCPNCGQSTGFLVGLDGSDELKHLSPVRSMLTVKNAPALKGESTVICEKCGAQNKTGDYYCSICGNNMKIPFKAEQHKQDVDRHKSLVSQKTKNKIKYLSVAVLVEAILIIILIFLLLLPLFSHGNFEDETTEPAIVSTTANDMFESEITVPATTVPTTESSTTTVPTTESSATTLPTTESSTTTIAATTVPKTTVPTTVPTT